MEKDVSNAEIVAKCQGGEPRLGFQIGGYYSHMWFEEDGSCLLWKICSDGEFPTNEPQIVLHVCDFRQIERFVEFWGRRLRETGLINGEAG